MPDSFGTKGNKGIDDPSSSVIFPFFGFDVENGRKTVAALICFVK